MIEKKFKKKQQKKSLGQHFLVDANVIKKIIELSKINDNDIVYEVGSGNGVLTNELCKISKLVYSFEIDPYYYFHCKEKLSYINLKLSNLDGFDNAIIVCFDIFFSSLPYYESRNALSWLCQKDFKKGILLLQREFVEKLLSSPGDKNYRAISILSQYRFSINVLRDVPFSSFSPQPRVNSALIEILPKTPPLSKKTINDIQFLFSFRKKNISFLMKYFKKSVQNHYESFDIGKIKDKKLGQLSVEQIYQLSMFLNSTTIDN
ncbi:MAG: rRNA adenine dimethyltransferase family protein [Candidatus Nitrosocosmicus sp.]